jgi:hypothetical protein
MGRSSVQLLADGRYAVHAEAAPERGTGPPVVVDLVVAPEPRAYFPGAALSSSETISGYVVPALRADATGRICTGAACDRYDHAQSYHDHNWGTWRGVTWEWGSARAGQYGLLYGRVQPADSAAATQPLFLYLTDSLGFSALFRPREIRNDNARITYVNGIAVHTPAHALLFDARGDDTLRVELDVEDAIATDTRKGAERGGAAVAAPFFVQMKGRATLTGRVRGVPVHAQGRGFFETYR